jgi:hypothetical protein
MYPHLPAELYKHIIDNLSDDRHTLYATSLVCKAFLHDSPRHLFYRVFIQTEQEAGRFLEASAINPWTSPCTYVCELTLSEEYHPLRP